MTTTDYSSGASLGQSPADGSQATKQLALAMMRAKGMDLTDGVLAKAIGHRLIHSLRM